MTSVTYNIENLIRFFYFFSILICFYFISSFSLFFIIFFPAIRFSVRIWGCLRNHFFQFSWSNLILCGVRPTFKQFIQQLFYSNYLHVFDWINGYRTKRVRWNQQTETDTSRWTAEFLKFQRMYFISFPVRSTHFLISFFSFIFETRRFFFFFGIWNLEPPEESGIIVSSI